MAGVVAAAHTTLDRVILRQYARARADIRGWIEDRLQRESEPEPIRARYLHEPGIDPVTGSQQGVRYCNGFAMRGGDIGTPSIIIVDGEDLESAFHFGGSNYSLHRQIGKTAASG